MPLVCIQCALKALVDGLPSPVFDEDPEVHRLRLHPDPYATYRERQMLEAKLWKLSPAELEDKLKGD